MRKVFFNIVLLLLSCHFWAQPGKDGTLTVTSSTQIVNQYSPVSASISAGTNTLSLATTSIISLCPGDLIMVYQAQGASLSFTNAVGYGSITAYNSAGLYEFRYIQSIVGNIITTQTTFTNSYDLAGRPQVIKVPQYSTLTINPGSSIIPKPWKDTTIGAVPYRFGGLVVIHAASIINNGIIKADGSGFRGGAILYSSGITSNITAFTSTFNNWGGEKGESIFGYQTDYDNNGGRYCMGAPANGGGGGNGHNSGGGGGANGFNGNAWTGEGVMIVNANNPLLAWSLSTAYIANSNALTTSSGGGRGGYSWGNNSGNPVTQGPNNLVVWGGDGRREVGGIGGRPLNNINADMRIYFGGGGGAPHADNSPSTAPGGDGGGIVYLIVPGGISGTGSISAIGSFAGNSSGCNCDGSPGGGAGGSIVIKTTTIAVSQTVIASGGNGGSQLVPNTIGSTAQSEGPGGGGGGGIIAIPSGGIVPLINGGLNGVSGSPSVAQMISNGSTQGATGQTLSVSSSFISFVPINTLSSNSPICSGSAINFTTTTASTYSWSGPNGFSSLFQNPVIVNGTTLMTGTYSVSSTFTGTCAGSLTQTIAVTVNPSPTLGLSNSVVCPGGSLTLVANGAASYTWNPGALIGNSLTINPLATTIYTVIGTSIQGCTASATKNVFVPSTMTLNIASSASSVCVGSNITLTASTSGGTPGYSYTWTTGPFTPVYNITNSAGVYIYTVTSRDFNNCFAVKTTSVTFVALPTVSAPGITICPGNTATLTASGAASYTWLPGNFAVNPFTFTPLSPSGYTVVGAASGCSASATSSVSFNPVPALSFNSASITCASLGSATVAASGGALGPYSYSWTPSAQSSSIASNLYPGIYTVSVFDAGSGCTSASTTTFTSLIPYTGTLSATTNMSCFANTTGTAGITVTGGSNSQSYLWSSPTGIQTTSVAIGLGAGIHSVVVTDAVTFCSVTQNFLITQPLPLLASTVGSATLACVGSNINLTAFASGGTAPYTYNWTSGPLNFLYNTTQTVGGTYIYTTTITDQNNCQATANATLTFVPFPIVVANSATICSGAIASLTASGAQTYTWYPGGFTGSNINVAATSSQFYNVIGNDRGCLGNTTASILVNYAPNITINSDSSVCEDDPIILNATGTGNFIWFGPNGFSSVSQNTIIPSAILSNAGVYSVTLTGNNGCSASTSTFISVLTNPQISATGASVCIGESSTLFASGGNGYVWIGPNNYIANSSSAFVPVVNNNTSGGYTVLVTGLNGCSSNAVVQLVAYNFPLPSPSITATTKICLNSKINLKGSGGGEYFWQGPENFNSTSQNLNFEAASLNLSGIYTLTVKNASNCSASSTLQLTVYPPPQATLSADRDKTCVPLCVNFSFLNGKNIAPIVKTKLVVKNLYSSDSVFNFCIRIGGTHLAQAIFTDTNGCVNTSTLILTTLPQPIANFEYSPENPAESVDEVVFSNTSLGENINKWDWFFNKNGGPISQSKNAALVFEKAGSYPVALIATNSWGCSDTIVKSILVEDNFSLFVPNAFSPNADGKNDIFMPKGVGILSYQLEVFDRWGEKVFVSNNLLNGWDGTFKGSLCKNEVFIWKIDVTSERGKTKNLLGHVTLNK